MKTRLLMILLAVSGMAFSPSILAMGVSDATYMKVPLGGVSITFETNTELIGLSPATLLDANSIKYMTAKSAWYGSLMTGGDSFAAFGKPSVVHLHSVPCVFVDNGAGVMNWRPSLQHT